MKLELSVYVEEVRRKQSSTKRDPIWYTATTLKGSRGAEYDLKLSLEFLPPSPRSARMSPSSSPSPSSTATHSMNTATLTPSSSTSSVSSNEGDAVTPVKIVEGLYLVAAPKDTPELDIVLINGFTGNHLSTWYHAANQLYWPKALLHIDLPSARILSVDIAADAHIATNE